MKRVDSCHLISQWFSMTGNYITLIRRFVFGLWAPSGISKDLKASFICKTIARYCWCTVFFCVCAVIHNQHWENPFEIREMNEPSRLAYKLTSRPNRSVKRVSICSLLTPLINQWTNQILAYSPSLWVCDFFHAITWVSAHEGFCANWPKRKICRSQIN